MLRRHSQRWADTDPQNCRLNPQLSKDNYPRMVGIQSYEQQFTLFCHGLDYKHFSAK